MKFEDFISRFQTKRKTQAGFMLTCPSHDDSPKTPSLHACPARDGGVLLRCFAGCGTPQVVAALGLTMKDLFATELAKPFVPPPAPWAKRRRRAQRDSGRRRRAPDAGEEREREERERERGERERAGDADARLTPA